MEGELADDEGGVESCERGAEEEGIARGGVSEEEAEERAGDVGIGEWAEEGPMGGSAPGARVAVDLELDGDGAGGAIGGAGENVGSVGAKESEMGGSGEVVVEELDGAVDGPE